MDPKAQNDKHFGWNFDIMHHQAKKIHLNGGFMGENTNLTRILGPCALKWRSRGPQNTFLWVL